MYGLEDPLDSEDFDPVQFINQRFPTEASLDDLPTFNHGISSQIAALDEEISKAVQSQSSCGQQASRDILDAQKSIQELFEKIHDIKSKASQSERMVQEICSDIKKLDYAKTHLQSSITSLKRLQMLITAVGQLESSANAYNYKEAALLLDAVKQLMVHFERYIPTIPMMADIKSRVDAIQADLKKHVHRVFREIGQLVDTVADAESMATELSGGMKSLSDACLVVDSLGISFRGELLDEFVQIQLVAYEKIFGPDKQNNALDQVDRRWAWFKRLLKSVDTKFSSIFPAHWRVTLRLCLDFVERTKSHFQQLLTSMESKNQSDVHSLLKALQSSLRFEQEMVIRYELKESSVAKAQQSQCKYPTLPLAYDRAEGRSAVNAMDEESARLDAEFMVKVTAAVTSGISGVFDQFLGSYVLLERKNLEEMLHKLAQEEDVAKDDEGDGSEAHSHVYGSSMNMFVFIKNSIKRCTALTTGQTFLSLSKEFKTCMQQYAEFLRARCPAPVGQPPIYRVAVGVEVVLCYLINTGEYCVEVVPQLEQMIKGKIDSNLVDKIDLSSEVDSFMDLVAHALRVLVSGMMDRLDAGFRTMHGTNWGNVETVEEESSYCRQFNAVLVEAMPKIRESLTTSYFSNFCVKLATEILQRYTDMIMKQKRISEMGTQQLLLDTYNLKTLMLHLQDLGQSGEAPSGKSSASSMYLKLVNTRVAHIEMILKLVGTPEELLVERFKIMWPTGQAAELQSLMAMKGMKRQDQQSFLETLGLGLGGLGNAASSAMSSTTTGLAAAMTSAAAVVPNTNISSTAHNSLSSLSMASSALTSSARNAVGNLKQWGNRDGR